jgi:hypothetical protein
LTSIQTGILAIASCQLSGLTPCFKTLRTILLLGFRCLPLQGGAGLEQVAQAQIQVFISKFYFVVPVLKVAPNFLQKRGKFTKVDYHSFM